jgi:hypothetical protein
LLDLGSSDLKNVIENIVSSLIWFLLGIGVTIFVSSFKARHLRRRVKVANERSLAATSLLTISGPRFELTRAQLQMKTSAEEYRIAFPANLKDRMQEVVPGFALNEPIITSRVAWLLKEAGDSVHELNRVLENSAAEAHHLSVWPGGCSVEAEKGNSCSYPRTGRVGLPNLHNLSFPDAVQAARFMPSAQTDGC